MLSKLSTKLLLKLNLELGQFQLTFKLFVRVWEVGGLVGAENEIKLNQVKVEIKV